MRTTIAALTAAFLLTVTFAPAADAAPTQVNVRIEGKSRTLFEGPILTEGHNVRAASDAGAPAAGRRCNGLNNGQHPTAGPTPTAAAVDAMALIGEGFDGRWYAEPFEDYFIKRWGPDGQDEGAGEFWGVVVNNVFTDVGGCQYQLDAGDEVLWVYNAFQSRPRLALYPADYQGGALPAPTTVALNQPFEVEVDSWGGYNEGQPPASPTRSTTPYEGAEVSPVETDGQGFERVESESPETVLTDADGTAAITFDETGWHRIKATVVDAQGVETVVRSNRLDVCVLPDPSCATQLEEDQVRTPPPPSIGGGEEEGPGDAQPPAGQGRQNPPVPDVPAAAGPVRLQLPRLDRSRISRALVGVSWRVLDSGAGIAGWTISSKTLGRAGARYVERASGTSRTAATLRLPRGAAYRLRLTVTDVLGRSSSAAIGRVQVPL
jgi:regulator of RNase E activity RraB